MAMIVVHCMVAETSRRPPEEQILLVVERRKFLKRRWRAEAPDGTEFGFDLESRLQHRCVIHATEGFDYVIVQEEDAVLQLTLGTPEESALIAWKLGNLHQPVEIRDDSIFVLDEEMVRGFLDREAIPYQMKTMRFYPLKVAAHAS